MKREELLFVVNDLYKEKIKELEEKRKTAKK